MTPTNDRERTRQIDAWIQNWALRLDETGRFIHSDGRCLTSYQRQTIDQHQTAIRARLQEHHRRVERANEAYVEQKTAERVVQFVPPRRSGQVEPLPPNRLQPALDRMQQARELLREAKRKPGWKPEAFWGDLRVTFWGSPNPIPWDVPSYLKPEMLYLLAEEGRSTVLRSPSMEFVAYPWGVA